MAGERRRTRCNYCGQFFQPEAVLRKVRVEYGGYIEKRVLCSDECVLKMLTKLRKEYAVNKKYNRLGDGK
jgi:hypothetical protein